MSPADGSAAPLSEIRELAHGPSTITFRRRSRGYFMRASNHPIEVALRCAQAQSLRANLGRWVRFAGLATGDVLELQAINVREGRSSFATSKAAHADTFATALALAKQADGFACPGVYVIGNRIDPRVATRAGLGQWNDVQKKGGTSDGDVRGRVALYVDVDVERPTDTSASAEELAETVEVATVIYDSLASKLGSASALGYGSGGNGRWVSVALDPTILETDAKPLVKAALAALKSRHAASPIKIDTSVSDAKRLIPAWGTTKKKGQTGNAQRPHRRTAIVVPRIVQRVTLPELKALVITLREDCNDAGRAAVDGELGIKWPRTATPSPSARAPGDGPFDRAKAVPIGEVLSWLGLLDGDQPTCPGCGLSDGSSVAIVSNGLKCSHERCSSKGYARGFRTPVDVVAEVRNVEPREAVTLMAERFGFEGFGAPRDDARTAATNKPSAEAKATDPWTSRIYPLSDEYTATPPSRTWLLRDRRTGAGVLPLGKVGQLIAAGGAGKTMACAQLAVAVATGTPWLGCIDVVSPGRVLFLLGEEDAEEVHRRIHNAARATKSPTPDVGMIVAMPLAGIPSAMLEKRAGNVEDAPFLTWLRSFLAETNDWRAIIIDPLSRFAGDDAEKDNAQGTRFVQALESLAGQTGATVMVAHHTNQTSRAQAPGGKRQTVDASSGRGVTSLVDGSRWSASLSREAIPGLAPDVSDHIGELVHFAWAKSNYSRRWADVVLRHDRDHGGALVPVDDGDLGMVEQAKRNAVVTPGLKETARDERRDKKKSAERREREDRKQAAEDAKVKLRADEDSALQEIVHAEPGINAGDIRSKLAARFGSFERERTKDVIARAGAALRTECGPKNSKLHFLVSDDRSSIAPREKGGSVF